MKKKILFINSSGFYNKEENLYIYHETAKLLVKINESFDVNACHYELLNWETDNLANYNLSNSDIKITVFKKYKSKIISYLISYFTIFFKVSKTDYVYLFYPNSFRFSILFALLFNKKYGLYVRGEKGVQSKFSKFIFKRAHFILTVSPKFTNDVRLINKKAFTIKPMIAYNENDIVDTKKKTNKLKLLYVGRVEKDKGSIELVKAIELLVKKGITNFILTIVGNGEMYSYLKKYIKENKLEDNIVFKGAIYDSNLLKDIYINNDIFILPSHHEGFPRVLYEAMIFRLVIVTTFVGTISNLMKDRENCLKIEVNNFKDIANKLEELFNDELLYVKLVANGTQDIINYLKENNKSHSELIIDNLRYEK